MGLHFFLIASVIVSLGLGVELRPVASKQGVQRCNTECQLRYTDCLLACEADVPCEEKCVVQGKVCFDACSTKKPAPPAPSGSAVPEKKPE